MFNLRSLGKRIEDILGGAGNQAQRFLGNAGNQAQRALGDQVNRVAQAASPVNQLKYQANAFNQVANNVRQQVQRRIVSPFEENAVKPLQRYGAQRVIETGVTNPADAIKAEFDKQVANLPTSISRAEPMSVAMRTVGIKPDLTKSVDEIGNSIANTDIGKNPFVGFVGENIVKPTAKSFAKRIDVQSGQENYTPGAKGYAEYGTDVFNIGSLAYTPAKAGVLAKGGMPALKAVPGSLARGAAAGAGINALYQAGEKGFDNINPSEVALSGLAGGVLNTALPLAGGAAGRGLKKGAKYLNSPEALTQGGFAKLPGNKADDLLNEARKYKSAEEFVNSYKSKSPDYAVGEGSGHTAPLRDEYNAPAHELTKIYPKDVYENGAKYYGSGFGKLDAEVMPILNKIKNNPDAEVTIYRTVPKGKGIKDFNKGDWITLTKGYAKEHGESNLGGNYEILSKKVKADEVFTDANSLQEFGYDPRPKYTDKQLTDLYNQATKPTVKLKEPNVEKPKVSIKKEPASMNVGETLQGYGVTKISNNKDFDNAVLRVAQQTGQTKTQARATVQQLLENARQESVSNMPNIAPQSKQIEIKGSVPRNPEVKAVLTDLSKSRGSANVQGSIVASDIATKAKNLGVKLDEGFTARYQAGVPANQTERELSQHIKQVTDALFETQKKLDPTIKYRKNYVPQYYAETEQQVADAIRKLQTKTGAANPRKFNTYAEAADFGLTPKYKTIDEMIGASATSAEKALKNRELVDKGLKSGVFTIEDTGSPIAGIKDVNGNQIFAQKRVADVINGALQENTTDIGRGLKKTAHLFETTQDVLLQGGVPGTNANFFVAGQAVKDTTRNIGKLALHPVQAARQESHLINDFFRGKMKTQERFSQGTFKANGNTVKNSDFLKELANEGLYIQPQTSLSGAGRGKIRQGWNTLGNNPTFGRYMPNRLLSTAQEVYSQSVGKLGHDKAVKLAADTTKKFTGQVDTLIKGRSTLKNDAMGVALFAPKYRESIINALTNVVKSTFPNNWKDPAYKPSRELLAGMGVTLAGYELLNRQITGHSMTENRQGQELSLEIPYGEKDAKGNQQVINIPFMPGFMTIPRAIVGAGVAISKGDTKGVIAEASKGLSAPLQTGGNILGNRDYFGRPIYIDQQTADQEGVEADNPLQAAGKIGAYAAGQFSPAWVRGGIGAAQGKPAEQNIATALEAPVRFGKHLNPETTAYFKDRDEVYNSLDKNDKAVWDSVFPKAKNINGEYIADKSIDYGAARALNFLDRPKVLEAANEMARRAKARGQAVDPLFDVEFTSPEQQRIALRIATLPPKDPQAKVLKMDNPWYRQLSEARSKFFDSLPEGDPNKPKGPIEYPEPSAEVAAKQDAYYQLTDGKMKRDFMTNNQDLVDQFAKEEQYSRGVRAMKNLPQYDKYPEPPKDVQALIDQYMSLPQKESNGKSKVRSAWIKSHPNEWAKIGDAFDKIAQYNLEQDIQIAAFEGHDITDKGIKAIASLGGGSGSSGSYGGGSGGGSSDKALNSRQYAVSLRSGGVAKPKVNIKSPTIKGAVAIAKPKVTIKKSVV